MKTSVLVTGGAGFIGSHTAKALSQSGISFVVLDDLSKGHAESVKWSPLIKGDIADRSVLEGIAKEHTIHSIIHFAGLSDVAESMSCPERYQLYNVEKTRILIDFFLERGLQSVVFSSTCATYGIPKLLPLTESHSQDPINPYGQSKLDVECYLKEKERTHGLKHAILRYFNASGCDLDGEIGEWHEPETHLIPKILRSILEGDLVTSIYGLDYPTKDGSCIRDYIHVNDLANAHVAAIAYLDRTKCSIDLNLGMGIGYSVLEVIAAIESVTGLTLQKHIEPRRSGDPPILVASKDKASNLLNWEPTSSSLTTIIESQWNWLKHK